MTSKKRSNVGTSVRNRLAQLARERQEDAQLVLTRYANERLLYRLAASRHAPQFVLKGAVLFTVWNGHPHRATRDIDLLGFGEPSEEHVRTLFTEVLTLEVPDDGVRFDLDTLSVGRIREEQDYGGIRVTVVAFITTARLRLQVDVGFGDVITPSAALVDFPTLLSFPAPRLRAYPRETVVAEKLEAMVQLSMFNSRMKDFYDVALLASTYDFEGDILASAIGATFDRRGTPLPLNTPAALTKTFATDATKQTQWRAFVRKAGVTDAATLFDTVQMVTAFVREPLLAAAQQIEFARRWSAGGPWRAVRSL